MSKKDKLDFVDNKKPKKKSHGCLSCLMMCLVLVVVFCGAIIGGGYWAWGRYVQPMIGLTLGDAFNVITGMYKADESKIVTNPYSQADLDAFYTEFKKKTYLQEDTQLTISDILESTTNSATAPNQPSDPSQPPTSTGNPALDGLLDKLNFDFSSLANYNGEDNIMEISDKQFAALLNEAFTFYSNKYSNDGVVTVSTTTSDNAQADGTPTQPDAQGSNIEQYAKYLKYIDICQVTIDSPSATVMEDVAMALVLKIQTKELVSDLLKGSGVPSFVVNLLPKKLFVGMRVYPLKDGANANIIINQIDKQLMEKVAGAIDKVSGSEKPIMQTVNETVRNVVTKLNEKLPISFVQSGCDIKPVTGLMNVLGVTLGEAQFLCMIRDIKLPTAQSVGVDGYTEELRDKAVQTFIDEFSDKYAFDNVGEGGAPIITTDNVFEQVSNMMQDENMLNRLNFANLNYDTTYIKDVHKVQMNYMALAGLLNGQLRKPMTTVNPDGTQTTKDPLPITILTMNYDSTHDMLGVIMAFDVQKMLESDTPNTILNKLAPQILPKEIYIKAKISLQEGGAKTIVQINNLSESATTELLNNIKILGTDLGINMSQFDIAELTSTLEKAVRDNLDKIHTKIGAEIVFSTDNCLLPSIFEVTAGLDMLKTDNVPVVTDKELHDMLRSAYTYIPGDPNKATNAIALVGEIQNKYYIKNGVLDPNSGEGLLNSIKGLKDNFQNDFDVQKMAKDTTPIDDLKPIITQGELGFILQSSGRLNDIVSIVKNINILNTIIHPAVMTMQIEGDVELTGDNAKYSLLLPKKIYINLTIDTIKLMDKIKNGGEEVCVDFDIDGMDQSQMKHFFEVVSKLGGNSIVKDEICKTIDTKIVNVMQELVNGGSGQLVFVEGGIKLDATVFDIAIDQIYTNSTDKPTPTQLRSVLQKVNIIPDEFKTSNLSTDMTYLVEEVNAKYYLNKPLVANDKIYEQISSIGAQYLNIIDGKSMATDSTPIQDLRPIMSGGELGRIFSTQVKIGGTDKGLDNVVMTSLKVLSDTTMEIVFTASITVDPNNKYINLLPKQVAIVVVFDKSLIDNDSIPCTTFTINDMTIEDTADTKSDMSVFSHLVKVVTNDTTNIDVNKLNKDASDELKTKIKTLTGESEIEFKTSDINADRHGGTITMTSIFGLAINKIYQGETVKPSEDDLRGTLKALFTPVGVVGQQLFSLPDDDMAKEQIKINVTSFNPPAGTVNIEVSDRNIGALLQSKENNGTGIGHSLGIADNAVTYKQALMFSSVYTNISAVKKEFSNMTFNPASSYMMIGVNIQTSALIQSTMLPDDIDATIFFDIDAKEFDFELVINNLSESQQAIINKILIKNSGNTSIFDPTSKDALKNNILNTEVCRISEYSGTVLPTPIIFRLRDMLGRIEKYDGHSVRNTRIVDETTPSNDTLIPQDKVFGGYIRVHDEVTLSI